MRTTSASLTSKNQVTVPAWVRKVLNLKPKMEIVWMELIPGEICVLSKNIGPHENPIENLCGILQGKGLDDVDLTQSLLDDRKEDILLGERAL